jgi:hypothetical protein
MAGARTHAAPIAGAGRRVHANAGHMSRDPRLARLTSRLYMLMTAKVMPQRGIELTIGFKETCPARTELRIPTKSPGHSEMMSPGVPT